MKDDRFKFYVEKVKALYDKTGIPTTRLMANCKDGLANKTHLQVLGLNDENDYRKVIPLPQTFNSLPKAYEWLMYCVLPCLQAELIDFQYIKVGKSTMRVFKAVSPIWEKIKFSMYTERLVNEINKYRMAQGFALIGSKKGEPFSYEAMTYQQFMIAYGEHVKNGMVAVLSANPWDYLVLSDCTNEHCAFSSCVRFNDDTKGMTGEYFNTALCYLWSDGVYIGYIADANNLDRKIGRFIVYIGGDGRDANTISTGREFGTCPKGSSLAIRDYIQHCVYNQLSLFGDDVNRWQVTGRIGCSIVDNHSVAYVDYDYGTTTLLRGTELTNRIIENGQCLECGREVDDEHGGTCQRCKKVYCCECDSRIDDTEAQRLHGNVYCNDCFQELFSWCDECMHYTSADNMVTVTNERGREFACCESCAENKYYLCSGCNSWHTVYAEDVDGNKLCSECLADYVECPECNQLFHYDDDRLSDRNGTAYCNECLSSMEEEAV